MLGSKKFNQYVKEKNVKYSKKKIPHRHVTRDFYIDAMIW